MLQDKLQPFINRSEEINELLISPDITSDIKRMTELSKEQSNIAPIVNKAKEYIQLIEDIEENKMLLDDDELGELAKEELKDLEPRKPELEEEIKFLMIPKDPNDDKNIYLELRAGAGGDEAAIFVGDLYRGYLRYAENNGWKVEVMNTNDSESGGYKEVVILIKGDLVYSKLKFESGTHRVQRVPATESQGRVHTSAITVAVMPEVDDVEIDIDPSDLKIDVMRASGNGDVVDGDKLIGALCKYLKDEKLLQGNACVATVMSNKALEDYLDKDNIKLHRSNVGDKYVLEVMKEEGINFGGEQSGHIIFSDTAKTGDGLASALQVLALILKSKKKASEVLNPFELYPQILHNMKVSEKIPLEEIEGLEELVKPLRQKGMRDLIRYSGTENKIRLLLEGKNKKDVEEGIETLKAFFKKALWKKK